MGLRCAYSYDVTKDQAITYYGSQAALSDALGIKQPSVADWGEYPPALRQIQLERLTAGKLRAEPECFPSEPKRRKAVA